MKPLEHKEAVLLATPLSLGSGGLFERLEKGLTTLKNAFRPRCDWERMDARLLSDAGLDESERERARHLNAPLIR